MKRRTGRNSGPREGHRGWWIQRTWTPCCSVTSSTIPSTESLSLSWALRATRRDGRGEATPASTATGSGFAPATLICGGGGAPA